MCAVFVHTTERRRERERLVYLQQKIDNKKWEWTQRRRISFSYTLPCTTHSTHEDYTNILVFIIRCVHHIRITYKLTIRQNIARVQYHHTTDRFPKVNETPTTAVYMPLYMRNTDNINDNHFVVFVRLFVRVCVVVFHQMYNRCVFIIVNYLPRYGWH